MATPHEAFASPSPLLLPPKAAQVPKMLLRKLPMHPLCTNPLQALVLGVAPKPLLILVLLQHLLLPPSQCCGPCPPCPILLAQLPQVLLLPMQPLQVNAPLHAPLAAPSRTCAQQPYPPVVPQPQQQWGQHAYPTVGTHGVAWAWPVGHCTPTSALVPVAPVCKVCVGPSPPGGQSATIAPAHATAPHALLALVLQPLLQATHQAAPSAAAAHAALHALPTPRHHTPPHVLGGSSATHT